MGLRFKFINKAELLFSREKKLWNVFENKPVRENAEHRSFSPQVTSSWSSIVPTVCIDASFERLWEFI